MGKKAEQKRKYILEQAKKIFAQKGFQKVTMKDIVASCNISRGGVYLYFNNTFEIFEAILEMDKESDQALVAESILDSGLAAEKMRQFLNVQKNELLNPKDSLIVATYEYFFAKGEAQDKSEMENKFKSSVKDISLLIQSGVEQGQFFTDPFMAAQNIVLFLEGLRISSTLLTFDEDFLNRQMEYLFLMLEGGERIEKKY